MNAIKNQQQGFKPAGTAKNLISVFKSLFSEGLLPKVIILFIVFTATWQVAEAQFQLLWYKQVPNTLGVTNVEFSHNSQWLLCETGGAYNTIYDAATGVTIKDSIPPMGYPFFSSDDSHLIGINGRKPVNLNLITYQDETTAELSDRNINIASISKDGKYYLGIINDSDYVGFRVWDLQTGRIVKSKVLYRPYDRINIDSTSFSASIDEIALNCDDSQIFVKQFCIFSKLLYIDAKMQPHYDTKLSMKVNIYDFNTLDSIRCLYDQPVHVFFRAFLISHNCRYIAFKFQTDSNAVIIYDIKTMQPISTLNINGNASTNIKFTPEDGYLVVAQSNGGEGLSIWDDQTGKLLMKEGGDYDNLDIPNDNKYIAISVGNHLV